MNIELAWRFHGIDAEGPASGTLVGPSRDDAHFHASTVLQLRDVVIELDLAHCLRLLAGKTELPPGDLVRLYQVIADRLEAGLSIAQGLRDARAYITDSRATAQVALVRRSMLEGTSLSEAMAQAGFPPLHTAALGAVRRAGGEAQVLRSLARQVELVQRLRHRLASLSWYPLLITSAAWCVAWGVTLFVAPRLDRFFAATSPLGIDLPAMGRTYYAFARSASEAPVVFSLAWMTLPLATWLVLRRPASRRLLSMLPAVRQVFVKLDLAALWSAFAQLQAAGVRPVEIFTELAAAASEPEHARQMRLVAARLQEGSPSLAAAVAQAGFPHFVSAEIAAGESALNHRAAIDRLIERLQRDIDRHCAQIERLMTATTYALVALVVVMTASMAILPQLTAAFSRL